MTLVPRLVRSMEGRGACLDHAGHPLVAGYLEFVGGRGAVNAWLAPVDVTAADVLAFLAAPRQEFRARA